jgi:hypothetical protein
MLIEVANPTAQQRSLQIQRLLQKRSVVFAKVERSTAGPERDANFSQWQRITKEIEALQSSSLAR